MTQPSYIPPEDVIVELLTVLFPKHAYKKASRTAVEFFLEEHHKSVEAHVDMRTLRRFVDFMIIKGYN